MTKSQKLMSSGRVSCQGCRIPVTLIYYVSGMVLTLVRWRWLRFHQSRTGHVVGFQILVWKYWICGPFATESMHPRWAFSSHYATGFHVRFFYSKRVQVFSGWDLVKSVLIRVIPRCSDDLKDNFFLFYFFLFILITISKVAFWSILQ